MKNFKLFLLSFALMAGVFTSCTNNEPVIEEQNIVESESIRTSLSQLRLQFNAQGDVIPDENPAGNIVFDFCFDFVYPLNLSYNNGTTVTVNSLEDLVVVMINSTDELYVNGIEFPFNVEVYNDTTDAIEVMTITNEEQFINLLEDCDFDELDCECFEEYNPVCVEIEAPNGESFTLTYPNSCYAACDGFTENDFIEDCSDDYNGPGENDCFTFNFPLTIITDDGNTITVNSQEEFDTALYNTYYFDFVYSFDITFNDGTLLTIGNEEAFLELLDYCFGDDDDCICPDNADPVCVQYEEDGELIIVVYANACYAECEGFTAEDFVECEDNNPEDCSEENISAILQECIWYANTSLIDTFVAETFTFNSDGSLSITNTVSGDTVTGNWETSTNPVSGDVFMLFTLPAPYDVISQLDWTIVVCSEGFIQLESGNELLMFERDCEDTNSDCTPNTILPILLACPWSVDESITYVFTADGTVTITGEGMTTSGTWFATMGNAGYPIVVITDESGNYNDEWAFEDCNLMNNLVVTSVDNPVSSIALDCD